MKYALRPTPICFLLLFLFTSGGALAETALPWYLDVPPTLAEHGAVAAAMEDLEKTGADLGEVILHRPIPEDAQQIIHVGTAENNPRIATLGAAGQAVPVPDDPQGFAIRTFHQNDRRLMVLSSASAQGTAYGLYWLWDRLRVHWGLPDINIDRSPALDIRLAGGFNTTAIRQALRYTATWVSDRDVLNLVPWGVEPEDTANAANREALQPLLDTAHDLGLKFLVYCDEFSYHPDWLAAQGATLDLDDPNLWAALQAKYRALFEVLPDVDGVRIRTGEHTRIGGSYRPLDIMHEPENPDWPLARRYRTFVQKLHEVVVGEFDKIYFHRTWVANAQEQHSNAALYRDIFTEDVPQRNLWLSPYLSLADRWYYQPFNPTFNQTPHKMVVLLASLDYHAAGNTVFPSFPGQYYQAGLQQIVSVPDHNLDGAHFGVPTKDQWDTSSLTAYTAFRLAWNPAADLHAVARDFAAIHLGPEAAPEMARLLFLSHQAYKDGIYIKPVAENIVGNTLPHLRLTTFQMQGIPQIDHGKAHIDWLRESLYEPCQGREDETMAFLELGRAAARAMEQGVHRVHDQIRTPEVAQTVETGAIQTRWLVETNTAYVRACLAYFPYFDEGSDTQRKRLAAAIAKLESVRERFRNVHAFSYKLYGVDQLLENARALLDDRDDAMRALEAAPNEDAIETLMDAQQTNHREQLTTPDQGFKKALHWRGRVDGKDILRLQGDTVSIEHLAYDHIQDDTATVHAPLPKHPVEVIIRNIESQEPHPYLLEQPSEENGYTASIYLHNRPPGYAWWEFEVWYRE